jgi:fused signal recognition particle receptor
MFNLWKKKPGKDAPAALPDLPAADDTPPLPAPPRPEAELPEAIVHASTGIDASPAATSLAAPAEDAPPPREFIDPAEAAAAFFAQPRETRSAPPPPNWRERLGGTSFAKGLTGLFERNPQLDEDLLEEI